MLSSKHIQPYRIAFIEYTVGHEDINLFENLFCSVMGFQKVNEFVSCNSKRHSVYSFNCTQIVLSEDLSSYENQSAVISGIGFHLNINDAKSHFSDDKNEYYIELYKNQLVKRALELDINASPQNSGNHLLSQSIKVAGINLYFTNNKKSNAYKKINLLIKEDTTLASKLTKTNDNDLSKNTVWMKDLHLHHCALYVNQDDRKTLSNFFKHCLQMKLGLSYILPEAELEVFPYKVNRVLVNLIESSNSNKSCGKDPYSHIALGTRNLFEFARTINDASLNPSLQVQLLKMGGRDKDNHYKEIYELYSDRISFQDFEKMKKFNINYDSNSYNSKNFGAQFFFESSLGLCEGIHVSGDFEFMPRAGKGAAQGIMNSTHKGSEGEFSDFR